MPVTYRYSATFDRTYEEEPPSVVDEQRWGTNQQPPSGQCLNNNGIHRRSASTDSLDSTCGSSGSSTSHSRQFSIDNAEFITTRVVKKVSPKPAHNPLQFVKVGTCPLYKKVEQQTKKAPEPKIKDEEEEWQSNLDNWKSRRRKQSEGALLRLEEIRRIEMEEQQRQQEQKKTKTKTFSEMMEERAQRPKQYNLHIYGRRSSESGLNLGRDLENGSFEKSDGNDSSSCNRESSDSALCDNTVEETDSMRKPPLEMDLPECRSHTKATALPHRRHSTGGNLHINYNVRTEKHLSGIEENDLAEELVNEKEKYLSSGGYTNADSGLDSLSSSHKTGDIADSASDFSQDSGSSLDSDFPNAAGSLTTGVELLEEFSSRVPSFSENMPNYEQKGDNGLELFLRIWLKQGSENKHFGFTLNGRNDQNIPVVDSVIPGGVGDQAGLRKGDQILAINGECTQACKQDALCFVVQQASYTGHLDLVIWRSLTDSGCSPQASSSADSSKAVRLEDVKQKQTLKTIDEQVSSVSHKKSSFGGDPKQKPVIQRTKKDIKPATDFKEKVSSFERRSSLHECPSLVSKPASSKPCPPVLAKPQLQSTGESDTTSLAQLNADHKSSPDDGVNTVERDNQKVISTVNRDDKKVINTVNRDDKEVTSTSKDTVKNICSSENNSDKLSDSTTQEHEVGSKKALCTEDTQCSARDVNKLLHSNNELNVNGLTDGVSDSKKSKLLMENCENEERHQPQWLINLQPIRDESGLNIIYDSYPEQTIQDTSTTKTKEVKVTSKGTSSKLCTDKLDTKRNDIGKPDSNSTTEVDSCTYNKTNKIDGVLSRNGHSAEGSKVQNQKQEDSLKHQYDLLSTDIYDIPVNLSQDEMLLADLDNVCRQVEPPKEKPPPPPPLDESDVESSEKPPVARANTTKEIKRELWKRRSDFLGIEFKDGAIEVDESQLPQPPQIEDILRSERALEREKRQALEQQRIHRLRRLAEEEEIARKEREIIENVEREEREKQRQELEREAALISEREHALLINEKKHSTKRKDAEMNGIQQSKSKQKQITVDNQKPLFQQGSSATRPKTEKLPQEKENSIRQQQDTKVLDVQPIKTDTEHKQLNVHSSESVPSSQNNSSAGKSSDKEINSVSSNNKTPSKKMILRQERERLRREQEAIQKRGSFEHQKQSQQIMQTSKQCRSNVIHQDAVPNRTNHDLPAAQIKNEAWDRDDIIFASRHPEAVLSEAKAKDNIENDVNQEPPLQSRPLSKQNLHSLGAAPKAKVLTNEQWIKPNEKVAKRKAEAIPESGYNQYHWLVQEAEIRRITEQKERQYQNAGEQRPAQTTCSVPATVPALQPHNTNNNNGSDNSHAYRNRQYQSATPKHPPTHCALPCGFPFGYELSRKNSASGTMDKTGSPAKPPRSSSSSNREQLLSVSGRKRCSHCGNELGRGAAMIIESLQLFYHIQCFCCCVCQAQLGNGSCGTDVRVRNNKLHCQHCYSNDEAGLKFSQV